MATLLIVEDDRKTNDAICEYLKPAGHKVVPAYDGGEALQLFRENSIDLVVLDIMLPHVSGLSILHEIRRLSTTPILMLTALEDEYTQVRSFDEQADDYMTKPFSMVLLGRRITALLRRSGHAPLPQTITFAVAAVCEADYDSSAIKRIKAAIQEADTAIENLWKALERGQAVDMITERIEKRKREKDDLQGQLAIEMGKQVTFTAPQIKAFLYSLKRGDVNDENNRRGMVNIFLRAIYLYDDRMTLILNGGDRPITIDDILLDEIEEHFEDAVLSHAGCSPLVAAAPPCRSEIRSTMF